MDLSNFYLVLRTCMYITHIQYVGDALKDLVKKLNERKLPDLVDALMSDVQEGDMLKELEVVIPFYFYPYRISSVFSFG